MIACAEPGRNSPENIPSFPNSGCLWPTRLPVSVSGLVSSNEN